MFKSIIYILLLLTLSGCATNKIATNNQKAARIHAQLVYAYIGENHLLRAKEKLIEALNENPHSGKVNAAAGFYYAKTNKVEQAAFYYKKATKQSPKDGRILNNYAVFLCKQRHYRLAIHYFNRAALLPNYLNASLAQKNKSLCRKAEVQEKTLR